MPNEMRMRKSRPCASGRMASGAGTLLGGLLAAAGGWILYSRFGIDHSAPLPDAIPATRQVFFSKFAGKVSYYVDRSAEGRPLVLVHSVNAAASAYEMRPLFDTYRTQRPVLAVDLPGFGFSERSARAYTPHLYEDALLDLLETQAGAPADVVALSLGCEFAARAAVTRPELFHSLAFISPTGFSHRRGGDGAGGARREETGARLQRALSFPLWARALFDLIATRRSIEYFLSQSFTGAIPPGFVDYAYATAHQPGAEHAPLQFISGRLFSPNIRRIAYEILEVPALALYDRDAFTGFDRLEEVERKNPRLRSVRIPHTRGLPHFERPAETVQALERFWAEIEK